MNIFWCLRLEEFNQTDFNVPAMSITKHKINRHIEFFWSTSAADPVYHQRFLSQKSRHGEISCLDAERWTMPRLNLRVKGNGSEWDRFPGCSKDEFKCITRHLDHCGRWARKTSFSCISFDSGQSKFNGNLCRCRVQMQKMLILFHGSSLKDDELVPIDRGTMTMKIAEIENSFN